MNRQCIIGVLLAHIIRRLLDPSGTLFSMVTPAGPFKLWIED